MRAGIGDIPVVRPTTLVLVPGLVEIILNIAKLKGRAFLGDLELIMCGAAPVPPRQMEECRELGITLCAGYGLTECANLTSAIAIQIRSLSLWDIFIQNSRLRLLTENSGLRVTM